ILHDALCRRAEEGRFSRREADGIFRQAMRLEEVAFLRRWAMWAAVRVGALASKNGRTDWWKDAWLVALIALLVLPVVFPPALMIVAALLLWFAIELPVWVFLELACRVRTRQGQPAKKVNPPRLSLKL